MSRLTVLLLTLLVVAASPAAQAQLTPSTAARSAFGAGAGPSLDDGVLRLLDGEGSFGQSNAVAFARTGEGATESVTLRFRMRIEEGGDGAAVLFLNTGEFGARGPAPFVANWTAPNLAGSFAVGIDVHNPLNEEPFGEWGNYQGLPEREVSLHWDGRELVKRVAPTEFRGEWTDVEVAIDHVVGGAEVSVRIGEGQVYDRFFVAELLPYELRPAFGAGTRADVATRVDISDVTLARGAPAAARRVPLHVEAFNHVLTDNSKTSFEAEVDLPPASWEFGRVILTLSIHDAGPDWDEWDRNGHLYLIDDAGERWDIVPFITSYRTECHWKVDVTHFRPWLTGKRRFVIQAGTNFYKDRGYMMSVALDFHHGTPELGGTPLAPFAVLPLWHTTARYKSTENHFADAFEPRTIELPAETLAARVATATTGHSQVGEFTPSDRAIVVAGPDGAEQRFENTLWKTDCYLNPNRPQFGTWKYSRAGWAPGDVVWPWWVDATPHVRAGETATFRYEPEPYDLAAIPEGQRPSEGDMAQASHVVRSFLVLYRTPLDLVPAPILRVTNVSGGSAAEAAGIRQGDYLASYGDTRVDSLDELAAAKQAALDAGSATVQVVVFRGEDRLELEITTGQLGVNLSSG